jgi:hypothetical protein
VCSWLSCRCRDHGANVGAAAGAEIIHASWNKRAAAHQRSQSSTAPRRRGAQPGSWSWQHSGSLSTPSPRPPGPSQLRPLQLDQLPWHPSCSKLGCTHRFEQRSIIPTGFGQFSLTQIPHLDIYHILDDGRATVPRGLSLAPSLLPFNYVILKIWRFFPKILVEVVKFTLKYLPVSPKTFQYFWWKNEKFCSPKTHLQHVHKNLKISTFV